MPGILYAIPILFMILSLGLIVFTILKIPSATFKQLGFLLVLILTTWMAIPLSVSFAQFKSEVNIKVTANGETIHRYDNVHSFNNLGNNVYSMTNRNNKSFKIFVNDGQKIHISEPKVYHPTKK